MLLTIPNAQPRSIAKAHLPNSFLLHPYQVTIWHDRVVSCVVVYKTMLILLTSEILQPHFKFQG